MASRASDDENVVNGEVVDRGVPSDRESADVRDAVDSAASAPETGQTTTASETGTGAPGAGDSAARDGLSSDQVAIAPADVMVAAGQQQLRAVAVTPGARLPGIEAAAGPVSVPVASAPMAVTGAPVGLVGVGTAADPAAAPAALTALASVHAHDGGVSVPAVAAGSAPFPDEGAETASGIAAASLPGTAPTGIAVAPAVSSAPASTAAQPVTVGVVDVDPAGAVSASAFVSSAPVASPTTPVAAGSTPVAEGAAPGPQSTAGAPSGQGASPAPVVTPATTAAPVTTAPTPATASAHASAPSPFAPPPLATQIGVELVALRRAVDGNHLVTIAVQPDNLGPVTISAVVGPDGMDVQLFSPSQDGRDALRQMLPDLRRDLQTAGGGSGTLDLGSRDAPHDRPPPRDERRPAQVVSLAARSSVPVSLHPTSARLDVLV